MDRLSDFSCRRPQEDCPYLSIIRLIYADPAEEIEKEKAFPWNIKRFIRYCRLISVPWMSVSWNRIYILYSLSASWKFNSAAHKAIGIVRDSKGSGGSKLYGCIWCIYFSVCIRCNVINDLLFLKVARIYSICLVPDDLQAKRALSSRWAWIG